MKNNSDVVMESAKEIFNAVNSAIQSQSYTDLSTQIKDAVNQARVEIQNNAAAAKEQVRSSMQQDRAADTRENMQEQNVNRNLKSAGMRFTNVSPEPVTPFLRKKNSRSMGLGWLIGGAVGAVFMGIPALIFLFMWLISALNPVFFIGFAVFAALTGIFLWFIGRGVKLQKLVTRFYDYARIAGDSIYLSVDELSKASGIKKEQVVSELKQMQQQEMFPFAQFDQDESTLMLTPEAYEEYRRLQSERNAFENEQAARSKELDSSDLPEDVKALLSEGHAYLLNVRNYNDEIPDSDPMSGKLYELENIMKRIFEQVRKEPSRAKELRKFMTYYLPTTDKLLSSYVDACKQGTEGENIRATKAEIESAMDVINDAFEHLLDKMFEDTAWDVSSDISVMKTMMAQDGLTAPEKEREKVKVPIA